MVRGLLFSKGKLSSSCIYLWDCSEVAGQREIPGYCAQARFITEITLGQLYIDY